jgi:hypothetical protein
MSKIQAIMEERTRDVGYKKFNVESKTEIIFLIVLSPSHKYLT